MVRSYNQSSERDLVMHQINTIVGDAKRYAAAPKAIGGGEGSYVGFVPIPTMLNNGRVHINMTVNDAWILFDGYGQTVGYDLTNPVEVVAQFDMSLDHFSSVTNVN